MEAKLFIPKRARLKGQLESGYITNPENTRYCFLGDAKTHAKNKRKVNFEIVAANGSKVRQRKFLVNRSSLNLKQL